MESRSDPDRTRTGGEFRIFALEKSGTAFSESRPEINDTGAGDYASSQCHLQCFGACEFGEHTCRICNAAGFTANCGRFKCEFGASDKFNGKPGTIATLVH
jgi:hypothetical protein